MGWVQDVLCGVSEDGEIAAMEGVNKQGGALDVEDGVTAWDHRLEQAPHFNCLVLAAAEAYLLARHVGYQAEAVWQGNPAGHDLLVNASV